MSTAGVPYIVAVGRKGGSKHSEAQRSQRSMNLRNGVKAKIEAQIEAARKKAGIAVKGTGGKRKVIFLDTAATPTTAAQKKALKRLMAVATDIVELTIPQGRSVKETIAERVTLLSGNVRYVYIGPGPLEDFRTVIINSKTGITEAAADTAIKILSSI